MKSSWLISYVNLELVSDVSDTISPSSGDDVMSVCLHAVLIYKFICPSPDWLENGEQSQMIGDVQPFIFVST